MVATSEHQNSYSTTPVQCYGWDGTNIVRMTVNADGSIATTTELTNQEELTALVKKLLDERDSIDSGKTQADKGAIQVKETSSEAQPIQELLTYDTNLSNVLGTQRLISQDGKKLSVEASNPPDKISFGFMRRALDEVVINLSGEGTVTFQLMGAWAGTISFYGSVDGSTFYAWSCKSHLAATTASAVSTTANGIWIASVCGLKAFKVAVSAYTSGTVQALLSASLSQVSHQTHINAAVTGTATVSGSVGTLPQRGGSTELTVSDSVAREAFYVPEPYNSNIIYYPGDVVTWRDRVYRCILLTTLTGTVSSPASATYWKVDLRPSRSLIAIDSSAPPNGPRLRVQGEDDRYLMRIQEEMLINSTRKEINDLEFQDKLLHVGPGAVR